MADLGSKLNPLFEGAVTDADRVSRPTGQTVEKALQTGDTVAETYDLSGGPRYAFGKLMRFARVGPDGSLGDGIADDGIHYAKFAIRGLNGLTFSRASDGFYEIGAALVSFPSLNFASGDKIEANGLRYYAGQVVRRAFAGTASDGSVSASLIEVADGTVYIPKLSTPALAPLANPSLFVFSAIGFASGDKIDATGLRYYRGQAVKRAWSSPNADGSVSGSVIELADGSVHIPKLVSPALDLAGGSAAVESESYVHQEIAVGSLKQLQRTTKASGVRSQATFEGNNAAPRLSFDGKKVVYLSDRSGTKQSWYQLVDGSKFGGSVEHPVVPLPTISQIGDSLTAADYASLVASAFGVALAAPSSDARAGIGSQKSDQIAARFGACGFAGTAPLTCTLAGNVVSAGANVLTAISILLLSRSGDQAATVRNLRASILGVSGLLTSTFQGADTSGGALRYDGSSYYRYTFLPDAGQTLPASVPAGTEIKIDPDIRQDCTLLVWMGRNNVGTLGWQAEVKARIASVFAAYKPFVRRIILIGITNSTDEPRGSANYNDIVAFNSELAALYLDSFVDVRPSYNAGTSDDVPAPTLTQDGLHYNPGLGRAAVASPVINSITSKGWYA